MARAGEADLSFLALAGLAIAGVALARSSGILGELAKSAADAQTAPTGETQLPATPPAAGTPPAKLPRGIRNNNPGNIVATGIPWLGKTGNDGKFEKFDTAAHGIRALALNILAKYRKGLKTIAQIITAWAPPSENNTAAYIAAVSARTGLASTAQLTMNAGTLLALTQAIITQENGYDPFTSSTVQTIIAGLGVA